VTAEARDSVDKKNLTGQIHNSLYQNICKKGWAAPVDVLLDIGVLTKESYEDWRHGRVPYLEKVCRANLNQLSGIMREIQAYAAKSGLKASWTFYHRWGKHNKQKLQFSKTGKEALERAYATHYVSARRVAELKGQDAHVSGKDVI
jgi:hypothetical protein